MSLLPEEKQLRAAILAVEGIGRQTLRQILNITTELDISLSEFWHRPNSQTWQICGLSSKQQANLRKFQQRFTPEDYFGWVESQNITIIADEDIIYPELLKNIEDRPLILYVKNPQKLWNKWPIAVVGTRQISGYGRLVSEQIVPSLVHKGASIVSGFMYGVDAQAHQLAIENDGYTVGVLGYGFDHCYPASQRNFFEEILAKGGSFITEYPPWVRAHKGNFPERNRIVAGMSLATVVIEAGERSGTQITARLAGEYGRGICAVPGPITNPYSEGTKKLVNQGARLVTNANEVLEEAGVLDLAMTQEEDTDQQNFTDHLQQRIFQELTAEPQSVQSLSHRLELEIATLQSTLTMMEIGGFISRRGEIWYPRKNHSVQ